MRRGSFKTVSCNSGLIFAIALCSLSIPTVIVQSQATAQTQQVNREAEAEQLFEQGVKSYEQNQFEAAIVSWKAALKICQELGDPVLEGSVLNSLATAYIALSRYEDAIAAFNQALPLFRKMNNRKGEAMILMNQGVVYKALSRYEDAIATYNQALTLHRALKNRKSEADTLTNLSNVYIARSRYQDAIASLNAALPIYQALKNQRGEGTVLMNRALIYASLGYYEEAVSTYPQALSLLRAAKDRRGETSALINQGNALSNLARYEEAITAFTEAISLSRMVKDREGEASAVLNRGIVYDQLDRDEAIAAYTEALSLFRAIENPQGEADTLANLGNLYQARSRYEDATQAYNQSLALYAAMQDRRGASGILNNLGVVQSKTRQFPQAEQSLRRAIDLIETIRFDWLSETDKIAFFETQSLSYRTLQQVLVEQQKPDAALAISEWGRAKVLVERLSQQLQPTLTPAQAPTIQTIQQIARSQQATLVEYSLIHEIGQLYIWVVQPTGSIQFRQVDLRTALPQQCSSLSRLIGNSRDSIGARSPQSDWLVVDEKTQKNPCHQADSEANLKALHRLLIEPIANLLPSNPNQQVVFIPDYTLFLVPFPALKAANGQFLIERHTIRTAASIQLLDQTRALKSRPKGHGALIVGNPLMPNDPTSLQTKQLTNLPNAEREATAIASMLNTKAITGKAGTKQTVLEQMLNAKVIHLATHGSFYDRDGFKSWLALAPSQADSGILNAEEIAQLKLKADLVVLSACDTGRGRVTGDGVVGLSRSFITAGVPSVIVSLWAVPDAPTAELMKEFYQQLQRNPDKAQALRQAMLKTLRSHPEPKNWAAFTLVGES